MRARVLIAIVAAMLAAAGALLVSGEGIQDDTSVSGRGSHGLRGAFHYLRARGFPVETWEGDLRDLPPSLGVLVLAAPFEMPFEAGETQVLEDWVRGGGSVVFLCSGRTPGGPEGQILSTFGLVSVPARPLLPWRDGVGRWIEGERSLTASLLRKGPEGLWPPTLGVHAGPRGLAAPAAATVLYANMEGDAAVFDLPLGRGRLIAIDNVSVWGHAWLQDAGNLAFLESVLRYLDPSSILFDEYHHRPPVLGSESALPSWLFDLFLLHLALLYALWVWRTAWPFGRARREAAPRVSVVERDLVALAELHRRSGHVRAAGARLLELARGAVDDSSGPVVSAPPHGAESLPDVPPDSPRAFLDLARRVGQMQASRPGRPPSLSEPSHE